MPTPRTVPPFTLPFTVRDVLAAGHTERSLRGWLQRGDVVRIGRGTFAPANLPHLDVARRIHINHLITEGRQPVTYEGAALVHHLCQPAHLPPRHKVPQRERDLPSPALERRGRLLVPSRALTAFELARWQQLPAALIPIDCFRRNRSTAGQVAELRALIEATAGWPGTSHLQACMRWASRLSGSALESYSRGLFIDASLPMPEQQTEFRIAGARYFVDFYWPEFRLIGEADGECKYDPEGRAEYEARRRQGRLQTLGLPVVRWGWAELVPDPAPWLAGMRQILMSRAAALAS